LGSKAPKKSTPYNDEKSIVKMGLTSKDCSIAAKELMLNTNKE
jgi:hypothetical protein